MLKADHLRRIERLEGFWIEDTKRRLGKAFGAMSVEELASFGYAVDKLADIEDSAEGDRLFRSGLEAAKHVGEGGRLGWQRFCETGGHQALMDFYEATEKKDSPSRYIDRPTDSIFDYHEIEEASRRAVWAYWQRLLENDEDEPAKHERALAEDRAQ